VNSRTTCGINRKKNHFLDQARKWFFYGLLRKVNNSLKDQLECWLAAAEAQAARGLVIYVQVRTLAAAAGLLRRALMPHV
jgi:hypothetical protein